VANEQFKALMEFYREFIKPDLDEIRSSINGMVTKAEMMSFMDDIYKRFDRLEAEFQSLNAAVRRVE
jgi:hypothetical protein